MEIFITSFALLATLLLAGMIFIPVFFGAPWHPTSLKEVRRILDFCESKPGQKIYDLGSGDGRVLIMAAKYYGLEGVGFEIDPIKAWISKKLVWWFGLSKNVKIYRKNFYNFDFRDGDILFIYLSHQALDRLLPAMKERLAPDVKIVCYRFCMRSLAPSKIDPKGTLFLYQLNKGNHINGYS